MTPKEMIEFYMGKLYSPIIIIKCHSSQDWHILFDEQPVIINALEITNSELHGIDYQKRIKFAPIWLQEAITRKMLVIENLDGIPTEDQFSFLALCRNPEEGDNYRLISGGNLPPENDRDKEIDNVIPKDVTTFIIMEDNPKYQIIPEIYRRSYGIIDIEEK